MKISKEYKIGLFMLMGGIILYSGFNYLKGEGLFSTNNKFYAVYTNTNGLNVSNPILVNGFAIGRVSRIKLLQKNEGKILVELDINKDVIIGDSSVAILSSDFLGNKSISLEIGDLSRPMEIGDTLHAVLDKGLADIFAENAQPVANNLEFSIKKFTLMMDQISIILPKIDRILYNFQSLSANLNPAMIKIVNNLDLTLKSYQSLEKTMENKLNRIEPTLNNMNAISDSIKSGELKKTLLLLGNVTENLEKITVKLSSNNSSLGKMINEDSLYNNLNESIINLNNLIIHFDSNPKHFLAPLGKRKKKIDKDRLK